MRKYEIMTLVKGSIGEDTAKKVSTDIDNLIVSLGGKIESKDAWGKRKLAYTLKHEKEGFYEVVQYELPEEKADNFKNKLNLNNNLVRYLITAKS